MLKNRVRIFLVLGFLVMIAPPESRAALVQLAANGPSTSANADIEAIGTSLQPVTDGQSICVDRTLCEKWREGFDRAQNAFNFAALGPFGRMTFLVNVAVITLGFLWAMLARRSVRAFPMLRNER